MSAKHPTRRSALNLPSRRKHVALAAIVLMGGLLLPVATVSLFGNPTDARAEGSVFVAKLPTLATLSPLEDETLATPDLLAGDVPEGVNPTDALNSSNSDVDAVGDSVSRSNEPKTITIPIDQRRALRSAPIPGLTRQSSFGPVPNKGASNALAAYKRPYIQKSGKRPVSLIVGGLGVHRRLTQDAIQTLPADVTLSFAAHSVGLQEWIDMARADGHEVLIEIPMESEGFDPSEPGADRALRVSTSEREMRRNLDWILSRAQGYAGVINFNGDLFLRRTDVAAPFIDQLSKTGLGFITDGSFQTPSLSALSGSIGQPFKAGNGLIDPDPIPQVISARLADLTKVASTETHPVGVGFYYQETLSEVTKWIATLEPEGLQLAPATASLK
jgi:polysaccharide deacetylase 2 family uncharacterized protein YibQ